MIQDPGQEDRRRRGLPIVPVFDGYRAFAIFGIVVFHLLAAGPSSDAWTRLQNATFGQLIDVLFIVSGFVVFLPTAARGNFGSVGGYAIRRAARLIPAYYMIVLLALVVGLIGSPISPTVHPPAQAIVLHLTGFQTLGAYWNDAFGQVGFGMISPVWTLSVEISFYLVLPLVAMAFYRHPRAGLAIAAVIGVAWAAVVTHPGGITDLFGAKLDLEQIGTIKRASLVQFPFWIFSFALGMAGAKLYVWAKTLDPDRVRRYAGWGQLAGLIGLLIAAYAVFKVGTAGKNVLMLAEESRVNPLIMLGYSAALATVMVATALGPGWIRRPFDNRVVRWLAEVSYGAYLSHALFIWIASFGLGFFFEQTLDGLFAWVAVIVPLSIIYGYLSARFLEQPIRRWARKFGRTSA